MNYRLTTKVTGFDRRKRETDDLAEAWAFWKDYPTRHNIEVTSESLGPVEASDDGEVWTEVPAAEVEAVNAAYEAKKKTDEEERAREKAAYEALPCCTDEEIAVQALAYLRKEKAKGYMKCVWSIVGNGLEPWCEQTGKKVPSEAKVSAVLRKLEKQDKVYAERHNHRAVYWQIFE